MQATGEFEVKLQPLETYAKGGPGIGLGRMSIDKNFYGDLEANSQGEMLTAITDVEGSAGYVALEQVVGSLQGREGTFVLQHFGMAHRGTNSLILEVVHDSGTGDLTNLIGEMSINIEGGKHFYVFEYSLPE
jgi:hypothetical protein